jgi:alanine-synthesizing transaminase
MMTPHQRREPRSPFSRINRLPPYVFSHIARLKAEARARGEDIVDLGMGNPDGATPDHIVAKAMEALCRPATHRYSQSAGVPRLRQAICDWYRRRYGVELDPVDEAIVTIGSKEGLAHLALAIAGPGDSVIVPSPCYPVHSYGFVIAGAHVRAVALEPLDEFAHQVERIVHSAEIKPVALVLNFPANPTGACVDLAFFERIVDTARRNGLWVIHDLAYADIVFDGYQPPSILQVKAGRDCACEFFSLSKSYNMPGWRIGFCCGNRELVAALGRMKSYVDYGTFAPLQVAAIEALEGPQDCVVDICDTYRRRRDVLCQGLQAMGWDAPPPAATMFVWARIPRPYDRYGSLAFAELLLREAGVAVSPGVGFGEAGEGHVRFALVENEQRLRQALRGMRRMFGLASGHQVGEAPDQPERAPLAKALEATE